MAGLNLASGLAFLVVTFLGFVSISIAILPEMEWTTHLDFENGFHAMWDKSDPEWITFQMSAPTTGWVAVGFSPNGGMIGADIVMGWVDNSGQPYIKDLHAESNSAPIEDTTDNYELLGAEQDSKSTTIRFRRKWNTCDDLHDYKITDDTLKLIYAFGDQDPDKNKFNPAYHGTKRGVQNAYLKADAGKVIYPDSEDDRNPEGARIWDMMISKVVVPASPTSYMCTMAKYPDYKTKHQMIGWRPLIQKENFAKVHHIVLYECVVPPESDSVAIFEQHIGKVVPCYTVNMPPDWANYCWSVPIVWTLGSEGNMLPDNVGLPLGEKFGGANYVMLEYHYENPDQVEFVDSSGIRTYYTDQVREFDMGMLWIGNRFSGFHFIPPLSPDFPTWGGCTSECTAKAIPAEGIIATHVTFHGHVAATKFSLRHIRDGVELKPLAVDKHYDNNYQQSRIINPSVRIMPGDQMLTWCEYDTMKKDKPIYGGITTEGSEMCLSFLFYYPKIPLASCQWQVEYNTMLNAIGVRRAEGKSTKILGLPYRPTRGQQFDPPDEVTVLVNSSLSLNPFDDMTVKDSGRNRGKTVAQVIDGLNWKRGNGKLTRELRTKFENGNNYAFCTAAGRVRIPLRKYVIPLPKFRPYFEPRDPTCSG